MSIPRSVHIKNLKGVLIQEKDFYFGNSGYHTSAIIRKCKEAKIKVSEFKDITITKPNTSKMNVSIQRGTYSFNITDAEIIRIIQDMINIASDALEIAGLLKSVDEELREKLYSTGEYKLKLGKYFQELRPKYLIAGINRWIPGPPQENYFPAKKGKQLDQILLEQEQKASINVEGYTPLFYGFVEPEVANKFIADGHLFSEDIHLDRFLLHGKYTHRLFFAAIRRAVDQKKLDLTISTPTKKTALTEKQLLELLVKTQVGRNRLRPLGSSWELILDQYFDPAYQKRNLVNQEALLSPQYYPYSCRTPGGMNSLLMCFGKELGLPHLQAYLLDSHYKAAILMVERVRDAITDQDCNINFDSIYTYCMIAFTTRMRNGSVENVTDPVFTATGNERSHKYVPHPSVVPYAEKIVQKINSSTPFHKLDFYKSSETFINKKLKQAEQTAWQRVEENVTADSSKEEDGSHGVSRYYEALKQRMQHDKRCGNIFDPKEMKELKKHNSLLQAMQPLIENIARSSSKQEKQQHFITFCREDKHLTITEMDNLFVLIEEINDLNTHTNPTLDQGLGIRNTASWQITIRKIQAIAYEKLEKEVESKSSQIQQQLLEKAMSMRIFNADKANFYLLSLFQRLRETRERDKINEKLIKLNPPSVADILRLARVMR